MAGRVEALCLRAWGKKGLEHNSAVWALRTFIKTQPESVVEREIRRIEDVRAFPILWEAGLSAHLQQVAIEVWQKIK